MMTERESAFVEEMGQALAAYGMTPMAGRMWGWLLICEPPEQTAADLAEALQASRGAISGTARMLATAGMIRRTTRRGDRREYFSAPPEAFDQFLANAGRIYRHFREITERGLAAIADRPPASRRRLEELHDVFAFVEQEVPTVVDRFLRERAGPTGRKEPRMTAVIHTEQLTKTYGPHRGITELDLDVEEGEIFGFLGPNGAGQDDDDARPARPHPADVGRAEVFGIETTDDPVAIHRRIGYLPGEFDLYDRLTGADTIEYFANLRGGVDAGLRGRAHRPPRPRSRAASSRSTRRATSRRSAWSSRSSTGPTC